MEQIPLLVFQQHPNSMDLITQDTNKNDPGGANLRVGK